MKNIAVITNKLINDIIDTDKGYSEHYHDKYVDCEICGDSFKNPGRLEDKIEGHDYRKCDLCQTCINPNSDSSIEDIMTALIISENSFIFSIDDTFETNGEYIAKVLNAASDTFAFRWKLCKRLSEQDDEDIRLIYDIFNEKK